MSIVNLKIIFVKKQKQTRKRPTQGRGATFIHNRNAVFRGGLFGWDGLSVWLFASGGRAGGKRMIQRLNEESGRQENAVLSTCRWCKQGWLCLGQNTDRWPRPCSSLLTVLNNFNFIRYQTKHRAQKNFLTVVGQQIFARSSLEFVTK